MTCNLRHPMSLGHPAIGTTHKYHENSGANIKIWEDYVKIPCAILWQFLLEMLPLWGPENGQLWFTNSRKTCGPIWICTEKSEFFFLLSFWGGVIWEESVMCALFMWVTATHCNSLWVAVKLTATHCNSLQLTATHSELQWVAVSCSEPLWVAVSHTESQWVAVSRSESQSVAVRCSPLQSVDTLSL